VKLNKRLWAAALAVGAASVLGGMTSAQAQAAPTPHATTVPSVRAAVAVPAASGTVRLCGAHTDGSLGYCLNDWGGHDFIGEPIKMENGGTTNENFWVHHLVNTCGGAGFVTGNSSCYGQWGADGNLTIGADIVSVIYGPGGCLASDGSGNAVIGTCPDDSGNNGSTGTVFAMSTCGPFGQAQQDCIISRPWSHSSGVLAYLESGGNVGVQARMTCSAACTIWGGTGAPEQ
jgi:hypothetical protein